MVPLGSSVTSGAFCRPRVGLRSAICGAGLPVEDQGAGDGGDDHVVVARTGQVGGHHRADDPADVAGLPDRLAGGGVEDPDRAGPVRCPDRSPRPPAATRCRARRRGPATRRCSRRAAVDHCSWQRVVVGLHGVGVRGARRRTPRCRPRCRWPRREGSRPPPATSRPPGWCRPGRSGSPVALRIRRCPRWCSSGRCPAPAGLVTADDDLVLTGAVEVGQCGGGVGAVRVEERPPGQRGPGGGVEGVGDLAERTGHGVRSAGLERPDGRSRPGPRRPERVSVGGLTTGVNHSWPPDGP